MKKRELKVGLIVEDRSFYSQQCTKLPFLLILRVDDNGFSALQSHKKDYFEVWDRPQVYRSESFKPVRNFKKV